MKIYLRKHTNIILICIVLIGFVLRFYRLGENPPGLNWDEASLGYNAYAILKTGADEYGTQTPLSIRSFDDYKPPLYVYLTVPSVALFGLNAFSVRFVSALLGSLAVVVMYFLTKEITNYELRVTSYELSSTVNCWITRDFSVASTIFTRRI